MVPSDFRCIFCNAPCKTVERVVQRRERFVQCVCGCNMALDWNPNKYRWRNMLKAARMTRRYADE